ncbi:LamG domain-containing protein [Mesorhizobium sp. CO1-1-8]|uniref:LamG domain-containing protein n=1 Tax=Mesorhizobium sp. CO1-1-8 TaxID=2876631 RepID=UPI001CD190E8|nr:LamG domain-containing protein [Mesorhizobium sp. CO1-1-8]MBZ9772459.1 LamG domain-containing protein [Mesorhizobium sp. CO1-1-8]
MKLCGYADKFGVSPGEAIQFYVNCDGPRQYRAEIVEMVHGDTNPRGPGVIERPLSSDIEGTYAGRSQAVHSGSYCVIPYFPAMDVGSFTLQCWIWPTIPVTDASYWRHGEQTIIARYGAGKGFGLFIDASGRLALKVNGEVLTAPHPIRDHAWHFVAASFDAQTGEATLYHEPELRYALDPAPAQNGTTFKTRPDASRLPLMFGAHAASDASGVIADERFPYGVRGAGLFNGKIERPMLSSRALSRFEIEQMKVGASGASSERRFAGPSGNLSDALVGCWNFAREISSHTIIDEGPFRLDGVTVNGPARALTGHNWTGTVFDWTKAPEQYGAIHFHDDDLDDARWTVDFAWRVPPETKSRSYAVKLTTKDGDEDYIPFWVVPHLEDVKAKIGVLIPTTSYMAYANEHLATNAGGAELLIYRTPILQEGNIFLSQHREYGGSQYDTHTDGSGMSLSTRLRPILNMRPKFKSFTAQGPWCYNADLHLIYWLDRMGYDYEVFTDEDLTYDGLKRLWRYNVVLTGSHPEHVGGTLLDALNSYTERGGRLMYFGADGWYWVQTFLPGYEDKGRGVVAELRRCESGIRTWKADPGEYYHQSTGELGGMWRFRGRFLHTVAGTGMSAQGFDISTYFTRTPDSLDPRVAWAFEGIAYDEKIGNFGLEGGGAAGLEVDIVDTMLGSPPHILTVATSAGRHTDSYLLVMEDYGTSQQGIDGTQHPRVRADMAYHETPNGGACFAFSSIAYIGALPWNEGDNNVSRLTKNVLDRFAKDGPLPPPPESAIVLRGRADYAVSQSVPD